MGSPLAPVATNTRDGGPNTSGRIFTWFWAGHAGCRGFSMGTTIPGEDNDTTFIWDHPSTGFNHGIPYAQVYIRLENPAAVTLLETDGAEINGPPLTDPLNPDSLNC